MWVEKSFVSQAVGANIAEGEPWMRSSRPRKLVRMALIGGAAAEDAKLDIFFGTTKVAHLINNYTTGFDATHWMWHTSNLVCPSGIPINCFITDATTSATATWLQLDIKEL